MASNRLEECLQVVAGRENNRAIEGGGRVRFSCFVGNGMPVFYFNPLLLAPHSLRNLEKLEGVGTIRKL